MTDTAFATTDRTATDLLQRVRPDPNRPGPDRWRVVDGDIAVWALIQHIIAIGDLDDSLQASDEVIAQTARDYNIPEIGVRAALAYYRANRGAIDTRLAINADAQPSLTSSHYPELDLAELVKPDPNRRGPDRWRVVDGDIAAWALIQHLIAIGDLDDPLQASDEVIAQTAADFGIPERGVRAALAYYAANRAAIDTRLAINAAGIE